MRVSLLVAFAVSFSFPVAGHHSDAALQMDVVHMIEGTVTEYSVRNPHTYFVVATEGEQGEIVEWAVQMASAITVSRMGWTRESLAIGDRVSVGLHPARDGRPYGLFESIERADGRSMVSGIVYDFNQMADPNAVRTTLEGKWIVDRSSLGADYPGGLDQLMLRDLVRTEKAQIAEAAYSQNSEDNPELLCMTKPTPGGIIYTDLYPLEIEFNDDETITIRSQYFDQVRTIYMDARPHPLADQRTHEGHSVGRWEDDVLVIDTTNFADNRSPYQNGIPSGAQKHVIERYWLNDEGNRMIVEFTLEDPEYIVGSMTHRREMLFAPGFEMTPFNCDLEATRRFVPE